jgi:hypothetical protein
MLGYLDMKTLLLSQRVCRAFKSTIDNSMMIKQLLFFETNPASHLIVNPLVLSISALAKSIPLATITSRGLEIGVGITPLPASSQAVGDGAVGWRCLPFKLDPWNLKQEKNSNSSWRRMLPWQPNCEGHVGAFYLHVGGSVAGLKVEQGETLGEIADRMSKQIGKGTRNQPKEAYE